MARFAIIEDGVVTNIADADADFAAGLGWVECPDEASPGWVYDGDLFTWPVVPLEEAKASLWDRVKARRSSLTDDPGAVAMTPAGAVQVDSGSKLNINGLVTMALVAKGAGAPFTADFTLADNTVATLDADQMIGLGVAVGMHVAAVYERARELRDLIEGAANAVELAAIDVEAGWP